MALAVGQVAVAVALIGLHWPGTRRQSRRSRSDWHSPRQRRARSFADGGVATTEAGRLALSVLNVKSGLKTKLGRLLVAAALGMTAAAAIVSQESGNADTPMAAAPAVPDPEK